MANVYKSVNIEGGITGADTAVYSQTFDSTSNWGIASGGQYNIVIPESVHNVGVHPIVQVFETVGGDDIEVIMDEIKVNIAGDVTISVTEVLDTRFAGKVVIR